MPEQPAPTPNDGTPIWPLVIADMHARDALGRERYGTPLQANNGRDALWDAYYEVLDLAAYLRQAIEEREDVEALVALMQRIGYDEELSYLACPGPPNCDGSHYDTCPVALARTAVAKFTG